MNYYEKFAKIKHFSDKVGIIYGTEDFGIYLYSIVKMIKPKTVLELGTGLGTTTVWTALALQENQYGTIHTIDDGSEWNHLKHAKDVIKEFYQEDYSEYISNLIEYFELTDQISFYNKKINKLNYLNNIDILFCDYSHGPYSVIKLLADYMGRMNENSFIFIDSASTYYSSFHTLESLIGCLNTQKIPKTLYEMIDTEDLELVKQKISTSKFDITHLIENKNRNQNSTCQIKISPIDIMPQPRINIRF